MGVFTSALGSNWAVSLAMVDHIASCHGRPTRASISRDWLDSGTEAGRCGTSTSSNSDRSESVRVGAVVRKVFGQPLEGTKYISPSIIPANYIVP
jgi:hypothetical protein